MTEEGRAESATPAEPVAQPADAPDQPAPEGSEAPEAPSTQPAPDADDSFASPLSIDELDEPLREPARRIEAQFKSAYTRARQADREETAEMREFWERLNDEERSEEAINELAAKFGFEPVEGDGDQPDTPAEGKPDGEALRDPRVDEILERQRQEEAAKAEQVVRSHISDGLMAYEEKIGRELSEDESDAIVLQSLASRREDGLPDVDAAIARFEAIGARVVDAYVQSKSSGGPDVSGSSGTDKVDLSTQAARLKAAEAVAARHAS